MPFLLLDDAADEATRRLHEFGQDQLSSLQSAPAGLVQGAQSATASAQDITQRLMQFGQDQLGSLQQQAQPIASDVDAITGRLHAFGQDQLSNLTQAQQSAQSLLTPMAQQAQAAGDQGIQPLQPLNPQAGVAPVSMDQGQQAQDQQVQPGGDLKDYARQMANKFGIDPDIFVRQIQQESGFNPNAKSPAGATGIAQFMPGTAAGIGLDPTDAYASLAAAAKMDADNLKKYAGDWGKTLAAYNAGPGNVDKYGGVPPFEETQRYVNTILQGAKNVVQQGAQGAQQAVQQGAQTAKQTASGMAFPVVGFDGNVNLHWGDVKGGSDIMAPRGTAVVAMEPGKVVESGFNKVGGNSVLIQGDDGNQYYYAHFDAAPSVKVGDRVGAGAYLGPVGNTGDASGGPTHLHIGIGPDILLGADKYGGTGGDYDAVGLLRSVLSGQGSGSGQAASSASGPQAINPPAAQSPSAADAGAARGLIDVAGQAKDRAMQMLDRGLPLAGDLATGGLTRRFNDNLQDLTQKVLGAGQIDPSQGITPLTGALAGGLERTADTADQLGGAGLVPPDLMRAGAGLLRQPGVLDSMQTLEQLATKYGTHDTTQYAPDDQKLAGQAMLTAGGVLAGTTQPEQLVYHGTPAAFARFGERPAYEGTNSYGAGAYWTYNPEKAGGYAVERAHEMQRVTTDDVMARVQEIRTAAQRLGLEDHTVAGLDDLLEHPQNWRGADPMDLFDEASDILKAGEEGPNERAIALLNQAIPPRTSEGANVRVARLAPDFQTFDATDRKTDLAPEAIRRIADALPEVPHVGAARDSLNYLAELADGARAGTNDSGLATAPTVYRMLTQALHPDDVNDVLRVAGFDGIRHDVSGGGDHDLVVFHGSTDKLTNLLSGTQGGQVAAPLALGTGAVVGLGALAANKDRLNDTLEGWQSPVTLEDVGSAKDSALGALEQFRQQQAATSPIQEGGWTAPVAAEIRRQLTPTPDENLPEWARPKPLDLTKPLGPQLGIDPYGDIVQKGIPQIVSGVQQGNLGDVLGGGLQTLMGAASVLPGAGAESVAGRGVREALPAIEQSGLGDIAKSGAEAAEDLLRGEGGAIPVRAGLTLGGAVAGGYAGNATAPEDAELRDRAARVIAGAGAGAGLASGVAGLSRPLEQSVLQSLRTAGVVAGPARATPLRGPIAEAVDLTKQSILTNPATHIANVIGNTIELGRQPIALAMGGRGDDALAGLISVARALPDAAGNAVSALGGNQVATLAGGASNIPRRAPVFRALSAADAFTRTLGEYQGMASEANRLLREAGISPGDPGAAAYLATHAADLYAQGARAGSQSVFGRVASAGGGRSVLDNIFQTYSNAKEGLLNSPRLRDQAMGALMDFFVPFSGIPVQMLEIGINRLPVAAQASGAVRAVRALAAGNVGEAQRAVGETGLETALQLMIAKQVADGNIRGPDDPEHPNSVRIGGNWVSMNEWGAYSLPMQIMASFADGYQKGGQDIPVGADVAGYYGPRFAGALNASLKPFQQGIPGENLLRLVSNIGQGGTTAGALGLAQDAINRITVPGAARFVENLIDPVAREVDRKGVASLWQGPMSNWPGLADKLPVKIDPTTGEALQKARTGPGILVGVQQDIASPITLEADRLNKAGYNLTPPKAYPETVSYQGAQVKLSPAEQRAVAQATGHILAGFGQRLSEPDYQQSDEGRKARLMQAYINAASDARLKAWIDMVGPDQARARLLAGQTTVGRLNQQATPPAIAPPFLSSSSLSAQEQAAALAGRP
jgi:soluble lytic murein transglycosylase-like protein